MPENSDYDVVIIGAGIQGAGIAQAAAACGYKTLVIEKFSHAGMGTSSKSSKLIHGGLRYLESGQFKLVRECLRERKLLLKNAPQLVKLIPFYIPVYHHSLRPSWLIWLGLCLYSLLSFKTFSIVKKSDWNSLDNLNLKNIKTIFKYYDAQTDDKKLTQAVIASANKLGADIQYNAEFIASSATNKKHQLIYQQNQKQYTLNCKCIVNCSGPWVIATQNKISPLLKTPQIELVAGTHIVIDRKIDRGIYYVEAADKRAVFIMPWKNEKTLIGTTERIFDGNADNIEPTEIEKNYLLKTYNHYFKTQITPHNILDSFAGLRVLPESEKSAFNKPRESLIVHSLNSPNLVTIIGGKLTAYRASSEEVLLHIKNTIGPPQSPRPCDTRNIPL
jgi:glycerol-3-phosphate dehydrogenase